MRILTTLLFFVVCLTTYSLPTFAGGGNKSDKSLLERIIMLEERMKSLESADSQKEMTVDKIDSRSNESLLNRVMILEEKMDRLESIDSQYKIITEQEGEGSKLSKAKESTNVFLYGRFWPKLTYSNQDDSSWDIRDALSRVGISANTQISDTLRVLLQGEWDVDIEANGDFGDARQAYVGIESSQFGLVAIGKQWDSHYNVIGEIVDIFYHRSSPFGWDNISPFRTNNYVKYAHSLHGFSINAGMQVNGKLEDNAGEDRVFFRTNADISSAPDDVDAVSVGISYNYGPAYLGFSYLRQNIGNKDKRDFYGIGGSFNIADSIYLAATYQYIEEDISIEARDPYTLDLVASFDLTKGFTALGGYFMYDDDVDGVNTRKSQGVNITLIRKLYPNASLFAEWLLTDYASRDQKTLNELSVGIRYDFEVDIM